MRGLKLAGGEIYRCDQQKSDPTGYNRVFCVCNYNSNFHKEIHKTTEVYFCFSLFLTVIRDVGIQQSKR